MKTVSEKKYQKALKVVRAYHQQIENEISEFGKKFENSKNVYKDNGMIKPEDFVECVEVHGNSKEGLTIGKKYQVKRIKITNSGIVFYIVNDKDQLRHYKEDNTQFKALN